MPMAAAFTAGKSKRWKQTQCSLVDEWINKYGPSSNGVVFSYKRKKRF